MFMAVAGGVAIAPLEAGALSMLDDAVFDGAGGVADAMLWPVTCPTIVGQI